MDSIGFVQFHVNIGIGVEDEKNECAQFENISSSEESQYDDVFSIMI